jgi:hypothetical protein
MGVPDESIEREVRAAYLAWTDGDDASATTPSWLRIPVHDASSATERPEPARVPTSPARIMRWEEVEAYMDAATDISEQVRTEIAATEAVDQASARLVWRGDAKPSVA